MHPATAGRSRDASSATKSRISARSDSRPARAEGSVDPGNGFSGVADAPGAGGDSLRGNEDDVDPPDRDRVRGGITGMTSTAPTWLEGAQRYRAHRDRVEHHDGTCDFMYPGTWRERDGRCLLPKGHDGPHLYRREGEEAPTREEAYQAERERKRRHRLRRERAARAMRSSGSSS